MRIVVTGYTDGKKIQAIKGIRWAAKIGLKDAKDVADNVDQGKQPEVDVDADRLSDLEAHGVVFHEKTAAVPLSDLIAALARYPRSLRVGDLHDVLSVTAKELA